LSTLDIEGLRVAYGDTLALDAVDLHVASGEILTLLGPSGCGKSTMLRAIAGLVTPDAGRIAVDGADLAGVPPHRRRLGLMFQDYALFPHRDVAGNVAFGPRMQRDERATVAEHVRNALALVGLAGYERRSIASLSGGEQQRVALARALAPNPRLLMLDEPLGSLDRSLRERLTVELRDLFRNLQTTTITVTHDQGEAFTIADRVAVMRAGRIVQLGTPLDVWRRPADGFVARFLGFTNVFDVDVRQGRAVCPAGTFATERGDGPACVVLRPDAVALAPPASADVQGEAMPPGFRGDYFLVPVRLQTGAVIEVLVRSAGVPEAGDPVGVVVDPRAVVVVDRGRETAGFKPGLPKPKE
jgi:thiamine transport system ATP-binding protein